MNRRKPVIEINGLQKTFQLGRIKIPVLKGIGLKIYAGEFVVIFGPSGSGKTTLLSLLGGLDKPTSGEIKVFGENIFSLNPKHLAHFRRRRIGMVFQQFNLVSSLNTFLNTQLPLFFIGLKRREREKRAKGALEIVGLRERLRNKPLELSGGEQQRVAIARALVNNPAILLVDEPTGNLDKENGQKIIELLWWLNRHQKRTIVLVTHNVRFARYADRIIYLENGRLSREKGRAAGKEEEGEEERGKKTAKLELPALTGVRDRLGFLDSWKLALAHFSLVKARSLLTVMGVVLGIASIVGLVSLGFGLQKTTSEQIANIDALLTIAVSPKPGSKDVLNDNVVAELQKLEDVTAVSPSVVLPAEITLNNVSTSVLVNGVKKENLKMESVEISRGAVFSSDEAGELIVSKAVLKSFGEENNQAVLGREVMLNIVSFSDEQLPAAVKKTVKIKGLTEETATLNVYLPLNFMQQGMKTNLTTVKLKVKDRQSIDKVRSQVEEKGFFSSSIKDLLDQVDKVFLIVQTALGILGGIALLVATLGIINTMTISLLERTREIGIMKAIGATNHDINKLFLEEASLFGMLGGALGISLAWFFGYLINHFLLYLQKTAQSPSQIIIFITPYRFAVLIFFFAWFVAILAGIYPARRAAKLSPLEALRND
ncbi:ATP-binding cassette domain-containing protein [Candidatus Berkelbacteria bacterium]|nr:ATP-binding cassette domain-containing protein [Candidatus Berkelbacteria bacterium]